MLCEKSCKDYTKCEDVEQEVHEREVSTTVNTVDFSPNH